MRQIVQIFAAGLVAIHVAAATSPVPPVAFEENRGNQRGAWFIARAMKYRVLLQRREAWIASQDGQLVRIHLDGSRDRDPEGVHKLVARSNYMIGPNPARWRTGIANYEEVSYSQIYPGIDLVWHGSAGNIEHDFLIAAGADPGRIRMRFSGAPLALTSEGDLAAGDLQFNKPRAYQGDHEVECRYEIRSHSVRFALGPYNHSRPLTIDPVLSFSTLLAGSQNDSAAAIAVDHSGNIYVAGTTASPDFPVTSGVFQPHATGGMCSRGQFYSSPCTDIFVAKLSSAGILLYSTYLGGPGDDSAAGIAVDQLGNAYLTGTATNAFPKLAPLGGQTVPATGTFVAKLNADGSSLIYATSLPSAALATALAVDDAGAVYLTGDAFGGLPVVNAFQAAKVDAIVFKTADAGNHWEGFSKGLPFDSTQTLTVDPTNPQVLYVSLFYKGVFKSTDGGVNWIAIRNGLDSNVIPTSLIIDPHAPQTLYLGTLNSLVGSNPVYKSVDGGATWAASAAGISTGTLSGNGRNPVRQLALDPTNSSTVYAATDSGLFKSTDAAASWNFVGFPIQVWRVVLDPSGTIYAGTVNGVLKSTDGGATWAVLTTGFTPIVDIRALAIDPADPRTLYAATVFNYGNGVYATHDGGAHWTQAPWPFAETSVQDLLVDPTLDTRVWAATGGGVLVSLDSGATWTPTSFPHLSPNALAADGGGNVYAIGAGWKLHDAFAMKLDSTGSQILYCTYLGGIGNDEASSIAVDNGGRAYITGRTDSPDFPLAAAIQPNIGGDYDAFVTVLDASGGRLGWSTYFGGAGAEHAPAVALDGAGNLHLGGTVDAGATSAFAAKFKGDGSAILYSTPLAGSGSSIGYGSAIAANAVAADEVGNTYIAGTTSSPDFPAVRPVQPALAGLANAFVAAFDGKGGAVQFATYLGGRGSDAATGVAVDSAGHIYIAGQTSSPDFPLKNSLRAYGCAQDVMGCHHAFAAKFDGPALNLNTVTNAASYSAMLAPGELVSVWGEDMGTSPASSGQLPLPTQLSDVEVTVNGVPAPLVYASASQVNLQIPFETQTGTAQVQVTSGAGTATQAVHIAAAAPAIFTVNASGAGAGAIQHAATYQMVTSANPASAGEIISIYCTGLGAVNPPAQTGAAPPDPPSQTVIPVQVFIAGVAAQVFYQGVAPGFPGLYQVNAQIPGGTPSGAQPLQIIQSGAASNTVTVAVQ